MSTPELRETLVGDALEEPLDTLASVLLFLGVGTLGAGVGITLFTRHLAGEMCGNALCAGPIYNIANGVLPTVAFWGGVMLAAGMLLTHYTGGESA